MKLLLDQNLAKRLVIALQTTYPGTQHVRELNLDTATDEEIWQYAKANNLTIVSKESILLSQKYAFWTPSESCPHHLRKLQNRRNSHAIANAIR